MQILDKCAYIGSFGIESVAGSEARYEKPPKTKGNAWSSSPKHSPISLKIKR